MITEEMRKEFIRKAREEVMEETAKVEVCEVNQWTSTGNMEEFTMEQAKSGVAGHKVSGGDSETIKDILGSGMIIMDVAENATPSLGRVWYREGENGKLQRWKANYDSSD